MKSRAVAITIYVFSFLLLSFALSALITPIGADGSKRVITNATIIELPTCAMAREGIIDSTPDLSKYGCRTPIIAYDYKGVEYINRLANDKEIETIDLLKRGYRGQPAIKYQLGQRQTITVTEDSTGKLSFTTGNYAINDVVIAGTFIATALSLGLGTFIARKRYKKYSLGQQ